MKMWMILAAAVAMAAAPVFGQTRPLELVVENGEAALKEIHFTIRYAPGGKVSVRKLQLIAFVVENEEGKPVTTALFPVVKKTKVRGVYEATAKYVSLAEDPNDYFLRVRGYLYYRGRLAERVKVTVKSLPTGTPAPVAGAKTE